jgi:hypothetical protein
LPECLQTTPTAAVEVIEIGDPAQANAGLELIEQDVMQLQTTPLHARQVIVRLGGSIVFSRIYKKCFGQLQSDTLRRPR